LKKYGICFNIFPSYSIIFYSTIFLGPVYGYLVKRFGCRMCGMMGGLIMALGLIVSSFAESVTMLLLTFGLLAGESNILSHGI